MLEKIKRCIFPSYYTTFHKMSLNESKRILEIGRSNSIFERYRTLMRINHPDLGGSPYICSKINEAKNYLLEYYSPL